MDKETLTWILPLALGVLGFLLGGGWPAKAYRKWSDSDLVNRMKEHFVLTTTFEAHRREEDLKHQRRDEIIEILKDQAKAVQSLSGAVERHTEALKFLAEDVAEIKRDREG